MKIDFFNKIYKRKLVHVLISNMTKQNKYQQFKMVEESCFLSQSDKRNFFIYYRRNINVYLFLIKILSKKYEKLKRLKFDNNLDMSLNTLRYSSMISLFHHNKLYDFDIFDVLKIIKNALYFNNNLFIETQYPKNPYNNEPFSIGNLINIYLYMRSRGMNIPSYFENFRHSGFCLEKYIETNEPAIKLNCIKNYCESMTNNELYGEIIIMLRSYELKNAIIHPEFPRETVVNQFKPYIKNYFIHCYSQHCILRAKYKIINKTKIKAFFKANPIFGRVIYNRNDPLMKAETKYKYLNYLSAYIPEYNYFEDIENFNNISNDDEEEELEQQDLDLLSDDEYLLDYHDDVIDNNSIINRLWESNNIEQDDEINIIL